MVKFIKSNSVAIISLVIGIVSFIYNIGAKTANMQNQIADLHKRIDSAKAEVKNNNNTIAAVLQRVSRIEGFIEGKQAVKTKQA